MEERKEEGPIRPHHLREAYRRYQNISSTGRILYPCKKKRMFR